MWPGADTWSGVFECRPPGAFPHGKPDAHCVWKQRVVSEKTSATTTLTHICNLTHRVATHLPSAAVWQLRHNVRKRVQYIFKHGNSSTEWIVNYYSILCRFYIIGMLACRSSCLCLRGWVWCSLVKRLSTITSDEGSICLMLIDVFFVVLVHCCVSIFLV